MNLEIDVNSILALDKQIAEKAAEIVQLKRSRNTLLKIARIPPEILGHIFYLTIVPTIPKDGDARFAGI